MKRALLATTCLLALGTLVACSTLEVSSDYDRTADFSKYKTFRVLPSQEIKNHLMFDRISDAVTAELKAKGLTIDETSADLLVALHARLSKQTQMDTTSYGYGWGGGWGYYGRYGYGGMGTATTTVRDVPVGTLIIDLVDASQKKMVWQAMGSDTLDPKATADVKDQRAKEAIQKMFVGFPPKPAK